MMYVYLDIVEKFVCRQCGICCRNDWLVTVDEDGYRRNRQLFFSLGLEDEFQQAFLPLQDGADYGEYAKVAKKPAGGCWFLTDQSRCRLQEMAGHGHLDAVCQWFPRYPMDTERGIELSLSFSCPAALELAQRPEPLRVIRSEKSPLTELPCDYVTHVYPSQQPANNVLRYYFEMEGYLIDILQSRQASLPDRFKIMCACMERLAGLSDPETMGQDILRLFRAGYDQLDAAAASEQGTPADWLIENYLVNYLFRKQLFRCGILRALREMKTVWQRLGRYLPARGGADADVSGVFDAIVKLELEYNHNNHSAISK